MKPPPQTFVREATGLVRDIGLVSYLATNLNGVVLTMSLFSTPWFIWYAVPGGDVITGLVGGLFFSLCGSIVVFSFMSATFPRSAAPYVAESRVLHPAIGWPSEVLMWLSWGPFLISTLGGLIISTAFAPGLYAMGVSSGNTALVNAAFGLTQPFWIAVVSIIMIVVTTGIAISGTRRLVYLVQLPGTVVMCVGVAVMAFYYSVGDLTQLQAAIPKYLGTSYSNIISYATTNYPANMVPVSFAAFPIFGSIVFTVGALNSYWGSWAVGEVKRATDVRNHLVAMIVPSLTIFLVDIYVIGMAQAKFGRDFMIAMTQIMTNNPGFFAPLPSVSAFSTMSLVPMMIANNTAMQFLMMLGWAAGTFPVTIIPLWLIISRDLLAWSFDRVIPAKFAEVNDRTHTPAFTSLFCCVVGCVFAVIVAYASQYLAFVFVATFFFAIFSVMVLMLSGVLIPLRKHIWAVSPARKYKIGPIPAISISGIIGVIFHLGALIFYIFLVPAVGWGPQSSEIVLAILVLAFILYWVVRAIRIRQGIDIDTVFRTIPPE